MNFAKYNVFRYKHVVVSDVDGVIRNKNLQFQIILAFVLKGISIGLSFMIVPLFLNTLGNEKYGVWVTMLSIASWISLMDIGIGNGLRNKLTTSLAEGNYDDAKEYITTAYFSLCVIVCVILVLAIFLIPLINWQLVFNINSIQNNILITSVGLVVFSILISFILGLTNQLLNAVQKNSFTAIMPISSNIILVLGLFFFNTTIKGDLTLVAIIYFIAQLAGYGLVTLLFFSEYKELRPSRLFFNQNKIKDIINLGLSFFIIQIAAIIIFFSSNFLITQFYGPSEVTIYNICFKLFSTISMLMGLALAPFWSAFTEAYVKNDFIWIKKKIIHFFYLFIPIVIVIITMVVFFDKIVFFWIRKPLNIPHSLQLLMALFVIISFWNSIFSSFLNGISRTKEQLITSLIAIFAYIPLAWFFAKTLALGSSGIILATIVCLSFFAIVGPSVSYKILKSK